jgi:hypothetical protein
MMLPFLPQSSNESGSRVIEYNMIHPRSGLAAKDVFAKIADALGAMYRPSTAE